MKQQQKIIMAMHIGFGILAIIAAFQFFAVLAWGGQGVSGMALMLAVVLAAGAALVSLMKLTGGAKYFLRLYSVLLLLVFPFGTIVRVYTLHFLKSLENPGQESDPDALLK